MIALDGTENKARLGANAILGVSLAVAKAAAEARGLPLYRYVGGVSAPLLPVPMMNILNGGAHADNPIDFQEFMVMPVGAPTFAEALRCGAEIFHTLKKELHDAGLVDRGRRRRRLRAQSRLGPRRARFHHALDRAGRLQARRRRRARARLRRDRISSGTAPIGWTGRGGRSRPTKWPPGSPSCADAYPIASIEDGMAEDDLDGWKALTDRLGDAHPAGRRRSVRHQSRSGSRWGSSEGLANSILIKVNQIGTLTETLEAVSDAHRAGYTAVMSHRSGETEDTTIADLAVATNCGQIKTGSLARSDRLAKYNQLLRIEEELGGTAVYPGRAIFG